MNTSTPARSRFEAMLAGLSAACWLAAWLLPAATGLRGWEAFQAALVGPFREHFGVSGDDAIPAELSALTNVAFVILFVSWLRNRIRRPVLFLKVTLACFIVDCYWLVQGGRSDEAGALLGGY